MRQSRTRTIAIGVAAVLAVAGGGAAVAATQLGDPKAESQTIVADAAKELGVQPSALTKALQNALESRVDAAVAAGKLTKAQGDALKARIDSGEMPLFAGPRGFAGPHGGLGHHGRLAELDSAAAYLGISENALRTELVAGTSLADVAQAKGKSVDGLVTALVEAATKKIDAAVTAGRLTKEQATTMKADLKQRVTDLVNGTRPEGFGPGSGRGMGPGHGLGDRPGPGMAPASHSGAMF